MSFHIVSGPDERFWVSCEADFLAAASVVGWLADSMQAVHGFIDL